MNDFIHTVLIYLANLGYLGIALGLMLEVIPSEIVLAFGGYLISQGKIGFMGTIIAGTMGGTIAQLFLYWLGWYGGRPFLAKFGKYILIQRKHIDLAEEWFNRYGSGVIFTARFVPVVRHAISIPAGIARMSFFRFTLYTVCAVLPWSILFVFLGIQLGNNWEQINQIAKPYIQPVVFAAVSVLIAYVGYSVYRRKKS